MKINVNRKKKMGAKSIEEQVSIYVRVLEYSESNNISMTAACTHLFREMGYYSMQGLSTLCTRVRKMVERGEVEI